MTMHAVAAEAVADDADVGAELAGKYLTFALAEEEYGLPVLRVREIIKVMDITTVPQMPPHVRGVINLRGKVIPVIDLRARFGFASRVFDERTCIIVTEVAARVGRRMMGIVVDGVCEVLNVGGGEIEPTPGFGPNCETAFVRALAKTKGRVKILLDIDHVLGADEIAF